MHDFLGSPKSIFQKKYKDILWKHVNTLYPRMRCKSNPLSLSHLTKCNINYMAPVNDF